MISPTFLGVHLEFVYSPKFEISRTSLALRLFPEIKISRTSPVVRSPDPHVSATCIQVKNWVHIESISALITSNISIIPRRSLAVHSFTEHKISHASLSLRSSISTSNSRIKMPCKVHSSSLQQNDHTPSHAGLCVKCTLAVGLKNRKRLPRERGGYCSESHLGLGQHLPAHQLTTILLSVPLPTGRKIAVSAFAGCPMIPPRRIFISGILCFYIGIRQSGQFQNNSHNYPGAYHFFNCI